MKKEPVIITEKIVMGISACCMGCPVRYNKKGRDVLQFIGREVSDFKWNPVCPESMSGLGVPREPIHLSNCDGNTIWKGEGEIKNRRGKVVTRELKEASLDCLKALERANTTGFVYMEGSPSCGVYRTSLKKQKRGNPPGIFGALLLQKGYFFIPAEDIQSPIKWWDWRRRLFAFYWIKNLEILTLADIFEMWYRMKFICQELDNEWAREKGREISKLKGNINIEYIEEFRKEILDLLRKPSKVERIVNSLWKNYSYYRKSTNKTINEINSPEFKRNVTTIAKELILMERTSVDDSVFFGTSPVIYRDKSRINKK
jgi:uncharacterized protein YbbK (DUF523 family)